MNPLDKILLGLGAFVALAVTIAIVWLCLANAHLRVALAEAQSNDTACHLTNDEFREQSRKQDQAVAALKTEADARARRAGETIEAAQKAAARFAADARRLSSQKSSGEDCNAAAGLFDTYLAEGQ